MKVAFKGYSCSVQIGRYANGQPALRLFDEEGPVATATAAVEGVELAADEVLVRDYSECQGMLQALLEAGVVEKPTSWVEAGYTRLAKCRLRAFP